MKKNILDSKYCNISSVNAIDKETIYNDNGADESRIRNLVMDEIRKTHPLKSKKRRITVTLIAAALTISVLATGAFAAIDRFGTAFGDITRGSSASAKVSQESEYTINSIGSDLDIDILGITGDDNTAYISLELRKKDGSNIVEDDSSFIGYTVSPSSDINSPIAEEDSFSVSVDGVNYLKKSCNSKYAQSGYGSWKFIEKDLERSLPDSPGNLGEHKAVKAVPTDNGKTLKMFIKYIISSDTPKDKTMNIICRGVTEYHYGRKLKTYDKDYQGDIYNDVLTRFNHNSVYGELIDEADGSKSFVEITNKKLDINFDISLQLSYDGTGKTVTLSGTDAQNIFSDKSIDNAKINISLFGIDISSGKGVFNDLQSIDFYDSSKNRIIMKDGKEYGMMKIIETGTDNSEFINTEYCELSEFDLPGNDYIENFENAKVLLLDPDEIDRIIINGVTFSLDDIN